MKKVIPGRPLMVALVVMVTMMVTAMTTSILQAEAQDGGDCYLVPSPQLGEGWQRKVCSNSDYDSWISPDGDECYANPKQGTTQCEGDPPINIG